MGIDIIFKLAGIGLVTMLVNMVLSKSGKDEIAQIITIVSVVLCILLVVDMIAGVFDSIRSAFRLY